MMGIIEVGEREFLVQRLRKGDWVGHNYVKVDTPAVLPWWFRQLHPDNRGLIEIMVKGASRGDVLAALDRAVRMDQLKGKF